MNKLLFSALVKDTLRYLRQECEIQLPEIQQNEKKELKTNPTPIEPKKEQDLQKKEDEEQRGQEIQNKRQENASPAWPLIPQIASHQNDSFMNKYSKLFKVQELVIPVKLVLPEDCAAHRFFLENVSRAITKHFAPSSVETLEQFNWGAKLTIAPQAILKQRYPEITRAHQIYLIQENAFLALEELDSYLTDRTLKLILWNLLKNFFSQNMPPS